MDSQLPDDETLARLLADAGSPYDPAALRDLLRGVLGAPEGPEPEAWMDLVAPDIPPSLAERLRALKESLAAAPGPAGPPPAERLAAFRRQLSEQGVQGFVIPRADEHQGEYVPPRAERLAWLTGFTGSAGSAVVLPERAALFVDGRYTLQAAAEVDADGFEIVNSGDTPAHRWLAETLKGGEPSAVGFDPWLHTPEGVDRLRRAVEGAGGRLVAVETNPVDALWTDQPPPPLAPVRLHPVERAGRDADAKRRDIAAVLAAAEEDAVVLGAPDSIAWLFNIRGGDVPFTPLALGFAVLHRDASADLFIDERKLPAATRRHLEPQVRVAPPAGLGAALDRLGQERRRVRLDNRGAPYWIAERLQAAGAHVVDAEDPCALPKACKNAVELQGMRDAHHRDGVALCRFLAWLDARMQANDPVSELSAAGHLDGLRAEGKDFRGPSFPTISGAGPNGAIVHYRVTPETDRRLTPDTLYLVDSGGQYPDGTTDVTRTVALAPPTVDMRDRFTRVLKGHIALATACFPRGTSGSQLDVLARLPLWRAGLDYDHGTGHGVGCYLGVHEGPQRISKLPNRVPLEPGMVVSVEPGYYQQEAYGIRIENLVAVVEGAESEAGMLGFEVLTLAPIDRRLIDTGLLDEAERAWVDGYHARVRAALDGDLDADTAAWLAAATAPL